MLGSDMISTDGMKWYHKIWFYPFLVIGTIIVGLWALLFSPLKAFWRIMRR